MRRWIRTAMVLLTVLLGSASAGGWWVQQRRGGDWPILIQQADGNLLLADERGAHRPLTTDADGQRLTYMFAAPAPDGRSVASVAVRSAPTPSTALIVHGLDGSYATLYQQANSDPFYLAWSPDSQKLAFLTSRTSGMLLHAVASNGATPAQALAPGIAAYFAWSPNSQRLLMHMSDGPPFGSLKLYEWGSAVPQSLDTDLAFFRAPLWLDGQRALVSVPQSKGAALATIDHTGKLLQQIIDVDEATVFVTAPNGQYIAYMSYQGIYPGQLHVSRTDGSEEHRYDPAPALTFFWSPQGDRLAFLTLVTGPSSTPASTAQRQPQLRWNVLTIGDGSVRSYDPFVPTEQFVSLLPYFDQYAQSVRLWDANGLRLLYAAQEGVYVLDVQTGATHKVSPGVLGFWMDQ